MYNVLDDAATWLWTFKNRTISPFRPQAVADMHHKYQARPTFHGVLGTYQK
jgi:hypothetical protein